VQERTGIGQYCYQLMHALSRIDKVNIYKIYPVFYYTFHPNYRQMRSPEAANIRTAFRWLPAPLLRALRHPYSPEFVRELLLGQVDIVHSTNYSAPRFYQRGKRLVMTVYDLSVFLHPEYHLRENVEHVVQGVREGIARADALITISSQVRLELIEQLQAPAERIVVTQLAPPPSYSRIEDPVWMEQVRNRYHLPEHFVLFVGSLEPRKNIVRLLQAFARVKATLRKDVHLVLAGSAGWLNDHIQPTIIDLRLETQVHRIGYVEENDLPVVYSLATVFAYPSLYEGFGLPVVEAMQCGAPVLTSNVSALPEIAGNAAVLVTPTDIDHIAEGLSHLLESADLRAELRTRGYQRAQMFSWDRCAQETLAVYRSVA
jgi:glycosyltransferase involved in cell wall biosynthesis